MISEAEVRYISTSTVRPVTDLSNTSPRRIDLTPWDLFFLPHQYMQRGVLFINPPTCKQSIKQKKILIDHLKNSLSITLDYFFPLAGRFAINKHHDDSTFSLYINCDSAGAEFIHATAEVTIANILNPTYVPHVVRSFFSLNGVANHEGQSKPLLSVQVTELIDGIFIGCSINHVVCDGTSLCHFFNSWSEISRGSDHISRPPVLERRFLSNTDCPIRLPIPAGEFPTVPYYPSQFEERVFHFTRENVAKLKSKANLELKIDHNKNNISSLQALLAHVWVAFLRARSRISSIDQNQETSYWLAIGNREKMNPPLPETYFGNSVQPRFTTTTVGELLEKGYSWGALLLNQMVMSHNEIVINDYWESWMDKPVLSSPYTALVSGGSPRFNMYGNDFGWGRPIAVRSGIACKLDGKMVAMAGPVEGSISIEASLSLETLKAMGDDAKFMEFVTNFPLI